MKISYDPAKRDWTLSERGLDFEEARLVFAGHVIHWLDRRFDYGEDRVVSVGYLRNRMVVIVWTQRGETRHVISMRKTNERETEAYAPRLSP